MTARLNRTRQTLAVAVALLNGLKAGNSPS